MKDIIQIVNKNNMNTQITPLEIPLKGTATQLFIRTSTEGRAKLFQLYNQ